MSEFSRYYLVSWQEEYKFLVKILNMVEETNGAEPGLHPWRSLIFILDMGKIYSDLNFITVSQSISVSYG